VLKAYLDLTYRGVVQLLDVSDGLRGAMGLSTVPAHTTLKMFADRAATPELLDGIVGGVLRQCQAAGGLTVHEVATDSTGVECSPASRHYEMRVGRKRGRYVKLMVTVACVSLLAVSATASIGPSNDCADAWGVLWRASGRVAPHSAYLDGGFDSERIHRFLRDGMGCRSYIPPVVRAPDGGVHTEHRGTCVTLPKAYGRRWHVESFFSGMKRVCGSAVRARLEPAMIREALLKVLAYTVRR
ncbi:MAG TPA: transposase, partial [Tepidisphaeraceae bacterium]|nr:transposase [Tepidisphaeraceae bacterium]